MRAFLKSVFWGTLAGGAPFAVLFFLAAVPSLLRGEFELFALSLMPVVVTLPIVLGASLVIGLPVTALLKRLNWEDGLVYLMVGVFAGFLIPIGILMLIGADSGYWLALLGAISGGVTGNRWWVEGREPALYSPD